MQGDLLSCTSTHCMRITSIGSCFTNPTVSYETELRYPSGVLMTDTRLPTYLIIKARRYLLGQPLEALDHSRTISDRTKAFVSRRNALMTVCIIPTEPPTHVGCRR